MTILDLTGQTTAKNLIAPKLLALKTELDKRLPVWQRISIEKKKKWVLSDKDPIMSIAWDVYKYLRNNFFGDVNE